MARKILLSLLLVGFSTIMYSQSSMPDSLALLFDHQLVVFPQEKIHVHTDKPYYISGERIWFRAHIANAASHIPAIASRYVYVELINPLDSIVSRIKIRQEKEVYYGNLLIPDDIPEGDYTLRAYTYFMRSQNENYFYTKTIRIGDPKARAIHTETKFIFESDRIYATFRFTQTGFDTPFVPKSVKISVNNGKWMTVHVEDDGSASFNFDLPTDSRQRTILLEIIAFTNSYRQYFRIPLPDDDFDVSFYPEGGSIMQGKLCNIAFKAMKSNGQAANISGTVYDQSGSEVAKFESEHFGMGRFLLPAENGKTWYAICQNDKGQSKRFDLPAVVDHGYSINVSQIKDRFFVSLMTPAKRMPTDELYLLMHTRGMVQFVGRWDHNKNLIILQGSELPSGVLHLVLFDANRNPVSERLLFINNEDQAQVSYKSDQNRFTPRSLVKNRLALTNNEGKPLVGSFSVAVTSDKEVTSDTTSSILTQLLLSSDLRGNIENPNYYFQNNNAAPVALDLLMLTQGWRRYDIAELAQGRFSHPSSPIETSAEISGTVKNILTGKPVENIDVTVISEQREYLDNTRTDKDGRFYLGGGDLPDSTRFIVSSVPKRGMTRMNLIIDEETFPERTLFAFPPAEIDSARFAKYTDKAEQQYTSEGGIRVYELSEVTITAQKKPLRESMYYSSEWVSHTRTAEDIERISATDIFQYLAQSPGVRVATDTEGNRIVLMRNTPAMIIVDDVIQDIETLSGISVFDVAQIDIIRDPNVLNIGMGGGAGAVVIFTKRGGDTQKASKLMSSHIKTIIPLGYQQPAEFYAPKYDTPEKRNAQTPDLRTAIHWQPVVQSDSLGIASFEFYTADEPTSYTVVIEGLANDGKIIWKEEKLWFRDE